MGQLTDRIMRSTLPVGQLLKNCQDFIQLDVVLFTPPTWIQFMHRTIEEIDHVVKILIVIGMISNIKSWFSIPFEHYFEST